MTENKIGKLSNKKLKDIVLDNISVHRPDVVMRSAIGEDCAGISFGDSICVLSTDPITASHELMGYLGVHVSVNDVASSGAEPVAVMTTLLVPPDTPDEAMTLIMRQISEACNDIGIELVGGHTEITDAVCRPVLSATVIGRTDECRLIKSSGARPGDSLIMTKWAAAEGTAIIAHEHKSLASEILDKDEIKDARSLIYSISILPEAKVAAEMSVSAMHDVTEGGILGAAWEMAEASGNGVELILENIPVLPATHILCGALDIDCHRLIGSGSLLIATDKPEELLTALEDANIVACKIGEFTSDAARILVCNGEPLVLREPEQDEIYKISAN